LLQEAEKTDKNVDVPTSNVDAPAETVDDADTHTLLADTSTPIEERREVSDREKEFFASICEKGSKIERMQKTFYEKVGVSNISVVRNLATQEGKRKMKKMNSQDIRKLIDYARTHCPDVFDGYDDIMQQYAT